MKEGIPDPCKKCGSADRYWDSKGYARCSDCSKKAILKLAQQKKEAGPPTPCLIHNKSRYWNNFAIAVCSNCNTDKKIKAGLKKKDAVPPSNCPIHNCERKWNKEGTAICNICTRERIKRRYEEKSISNILPTPCPIHNLERTWSKNALPYCKECNREEKIRRADRNKSLGAPSRCGIHGCEQIWDTEGSVYCTECNRDYRKKLAEKRRAGSPPSNCSIHQTERMWDAGGNAICNTCVIEKNRRRGEDRRSGAPPLDCKVHGTSRYWDIYGRPVCRICYKDNVLKLAERKRSEGSPSDCIIHNLPREWNNDGRPICKQCEEEYRDNLDPLYKRWYAINDRCHNPENNEYHNYGGRGIFVYSEWRRDPEGTFQNNYDTYCKFRNWIISNIGNIPTDDNNTLDRIDNNKGYEPDNLRWADRQIQVSNRRVSIANKAYTSEQNILTYENKDMTLLEFSKITGMHLEVVKYRWAQHPTNTEWILHDDYDNRYYEYNGHKYNMTELCLISGLWWKTMWARVKKMGWDITRAVEEPLNYTKIDPVDSFVSFTPEERHHLILKQYRP